MASMAHQVDAGGVVQIESPKKAYTGYTTPFDADMQHAVPLQNLGERLSRLGTAGRAVDLNHLSTTAPSAVDNAEDDRGKLQWIKKNQKFLACLWSIGACTFLC